MAGHTRQPFRIDLTPIVNTMGMAWVVEQLGPRRIIEAVGVRRIIEAVGLKRIVEHFGVRRIIDAIGGVKQLWAEMSPEHRRQFKRLIQQRLPVTEGGRGAQARRRARRSSGRQHAPCLTRARCSL